MDKTFFKKNGPLMIISVLLALVTFSFLHFEIDKIETSKSGEEAAVSVIETATPEEMTSIPLLLKNESSPDNNISEKPSLLPVLNTSLSKEPIPAVNVSNPGLNINIEGKENTSSVFGNPSLSTSSEKENGENGVQKVGFSPVIPDMASEESKKAVKVKTLMGLKIKPKSEWIARKNDHVDFFDQPFISVVRQKDRKDSVDLFQTIGMNNESEKAPVLSIPSQNGVLNSVVSTKSPVEKNTKEVNPSLPGTIKSNQSSVLLPGTTSAKTFIPSNKAVSPLLPQPGTNREVQPIQGQTETETGTQSVPGQSTTSILPGPEIVPVTKTATNVQEVSNETPIQCMNEVWLVSTECISNCDRSPEELVYWQLNSGRWEVRTISDFERGNGKNFATVIFIHGNNTDTDGALVDASALRCRIQEIQQCYGSRQPVRLVVWKWNSSKMKKLIRRDLQIKACIAEQDGLCLARFLERIPISERITLIGFSFGARTIGTALETIAVQNRTLSPSTRTIFVLAANDYGDFGLYGKYGHGIQKLAAVWNIYNSTDNVLRFYPMLYGHGGPNAMGYAPLQVEFNLPEGICSYNMAPYGSRHQFPDTIRCIPAPYLQRVIFDK